MTPLELSICLHYHGHCEDMPWVKESAPIKPDTMSRLVSHGLLTLNDPAIVKTGMLYGPTDKLHAFVEMLCATPLPEHRFVDPRNPITECNDAHWAADLRTPVDTNAPLAIIQENNKNVSDHFGE